RSALKCLSYACPALISQASRNGFLEAIAAHKCIVGSSRDDKTRRHWHVRVGELAKIGALTSRKRDILRSQCIKSVYYFFVFHSPHDTYPARVVFQTWI